MRTRFQPEEVAVERHVGICSLAVNPCAPGTAVDDDLLAAQERSLHLDMSTRVIVLDGHSITSRRFHHERRQRPIRAANDKRQSCAAASGHDLLPLPPCNGIERRERQLAGTVLEEGVPGIRACAHGVAIDEPRFAGELQVASGIRGEPRRRFVAQRREPLRVLVFGKVEEEPHAQSLGRDTCREQDRTGTAWHLSCVHGEAVCRGQYHLGGREGREVVPIELDGARHQSRPLARP